MLHLPYHHMRQDSTWFIRHFMAHGFCETRLSHRCTDEILYLRISMRAGLHKDAGLGFFFGNCHNDAIWVVRATNLRGEGCAWPPSTTGSGSLRNTKHDKGRLILSDLADFHHFHPLQRERVGTSHWNSWELGSRKPSLQTSIPKIKLCQALREKHLNLARADAKIAPLNGSMMSLWTVFAWSSNNLNL